MSTIWKTALTLLIAVIALAACVQLDVSTPLTPFPVAFPQTNLRDDPETAIGGIAPSPQCPEGRIVLSTRSGHLNSFPLAHPLSRDQIRVEDIRPGPYTRGSDNQLVRLANGDLLVVYLGATDSALPGPLPDWWRDGRTPDGTRGALLTWRTSCWPVWEGPWLLDSASAVALDGGSPHQPTTGLCAQSMPGVGGFDRPEIFVDPWGVNVDDVRKQRIFASIQCKVEMPRPLDRQIAIFVSDDSGVTWKPSSIRFPESEAMPMAVSPEGRLFMFHCKQNENFTVYTPTLYWSDDHGQSLAPGGKGTDFATLSAEIPPCGSLPNDAVHLAQPGVFAPALSRLDDNWLLVAYPAIETFLDDSGRAIQRQVAKVLLVDTGRIGASGPATAILTATIRATMLRGSILQFAFITDDRPLAEAPLSMLYWIETDGELTGANVKMAARYQLWTGHYRYGSPNFLSDPAGWLVPSRDARGNYMSLGDYMKGGFFFDRGSRNYIAAWPGAGEINVRIVTVPVP